MKLQTIGALAASLLVTALPTTAAASTAQDWNLATARDHTALKLFNRIVDEQASHPVTLFGDLAYGKMLDIVAVKIATTPCVKQFMHTVAQAYRVQPVAPQIAVKLAWRSSAQRIACMHRLSR